MRSLSLVSCRLASCQCCGNTATIQRRYDGWLYVECPRCGTCGPTRAMLADAVAGWNSLMRHRFVASWSGDALCIGDAEIGFVTYDPDDQCWIAECKLTERHERHGTEGEARRWLEIEARLTGVDVTEVCRG